MAELLARAEPQDKKDTQERPTTRHIRIRSILFLEVTEVQCEQPSLQVGGLYQKAPRQFWLLCDNSCDALRVDGQGILPRNGADGSHKRLRVSKLLALKRADMVFAAQETHLCRRLTVSTPERRKTETSQKPVHFDFALADALLDWKARSPYNQSTDYVFASAEKHGDQPLGPFNAKSRHIRSAALRAGIVKHVHGHVFIHSFTTLLKRDGDERDGDERR